jgi:toxin CptA
MTGGLLLLLALLSAATMGYAITRGATCMVAAAGEMLREGKAARMVALAEASLWVAGGLSLALLAGLMPRPVGAHAIGWATVAGGALLGFGAQINRACVFGAIARLGAGELHYLLTMAGFLLGCIAVQPLLPVAPAGGMAMARFPALPAAVVAMLLAFLLWRAVCLVRTALRGEFAAHIWTPHQATNVIGISFVALVLAAGAWTYPDALAQLSRGMHMDSLARLALFAALLAGAALGGAGKRVAPEARFTSPGALRCLAGGALMGMGSLLIPGGNDNLILVGLPFLLPYAWVAIGTMTVSIWIGMVLEDGIKSALVSRTVRE